MSLFPSFTIDLRPEPFEAIVRPLNERACSLSIGEVGPLKALTIFFPADRIDQVQRIADALNEMGKPVEVAKAEAA